jgi:hypothetical protein
LCVRPVPTFSTLLDAIARSARFPADRTNFACPKTVEMTHDQVDVPHRASNHPP